MIKVIGLPSIPDDNSIAYIYSVLAALLHADPHANLELYASNEKVSIVILPSTGEFKESIIQNMLYVHKRLKVKVDFCKSTKLAEGVYFAINLYN